MKKYAIFCLCLISLTACAPSVPKVQAKTTAEDASLYYFNESAAEISVSDGDTTAESSENQAKTEVSFTLDLVPEYQGDAFVEINGGQPFFTENYPVGTEVYAPLDNLGRCGAAYACVGREIMPEYGETRGDIGMIKPTGWVQNKYEGIIDSDPPYLWNRCHLIAWMLGAENANECNLVTGSRYMNTEGMLPWEDKVAHYIYETENHVSYRVTPCFMGDELVCRGVLMEARSVEDDTICFCVFCYNVQPGIVIDYATGNNHPEE